ncbi:coniferyl aldehyde dehydrogenase [Thiopseudomonas alkaliphila]|uniref:Aldehyde dehydrogenase n=1 Tax=Thiopseudomonas alkaliphila TaxID=1697053 RepID=A0A0K1XDV1_9GAMM|nr:coniferyl aldehyde dehydrogenase [Thiopseudomonas alkaliphila]AKX59439.1 coniferyl aldehyde dehydrogenase [Thiopseudomonas alkaliphila]MDM1716577.1 coniferyl aldehyde dehydrogenase [Thiopseudomonas alkaliphila]
MPLSEQQLEVQLQELDSLFSQQKKAFNADKMPTYEQRYQWLDQLYQLLFEHQGALINAISQDFSHRSADETRLAELMPSLHGINYARRHLKHWLKPSKRKVGLAFQPAKAEVHYQPLGCVGIIVPWNYPLFLAIGPLTAALAAGNRVMLKLSEFTPATSVLLKQLLEDCFPEELVSVVLGEAQVGAAFSALAFDHLLFTGATSVGKQVMRAAANHLTPVTLELGGKSPAIISAEVPMLDAVERIAFGKLLNAGQTCVAPDYVLVPEARQQEFIEAYLAQVQQFYPAISDNPDYSAIINQRHLQRLQGYLDEAEQLGATVLYSHPLPTASSTERRLVPSVVTGVTDQMRLMQDEIFGPILPVVPYQTLEQALAYIEQRPRPLALYYFGYNQDQQQQVLEQSHSGGVCLNDTLMHVAQEDLPFGGIGPSGMGCYHGHEGFLTFSHAKSVFIKQRFNAAKVIYPPYGGWLQKMVNKFFVR